MPIDAENPYDPPPALPPAPPEATVDSILYDKTNPGWVEVSFSDGSPPRTMPAEEAEALPKTPTTGTPVAYGEAFGPPVAPIAPNAVLQPPGGGVFWGAPEAPAPEAPPAEQPLTDPMTGMPLNQAGAVAVGATPRPNEAVSAGEVTAKPNIGPDMAEIITPGSPGGAMLPSETTYSEGSTQTQFAGDLDAASADLGTAYDRAADATRVKDWQTYQSRYGQNITQEFGARQRQAQVEAQLAQAQNERETQERFIRTMEENPIDPDDFWNKSPGRQAASWIALALSGFLQGATRGQNPALNQMMQSLNAAQDRWLANARAERAGVFARREAGLRDAKAAEDSLKMQLSGIVDKRWDLAAQRAGIPVPPGAETYRTQAGVQRAEAQARLAATAVGQATEQTQRQLKAAAATGPQTRFDVELRALNIDPKKHQEAMTASTGNVRTAVSSADELASIRDALRTIAAKHNGKLPSQSTLSWRQLGLAPFAARMGIKNADEQVTTEQLLQRASLAYITSLGNVKTIDSNTERERFERAVNTGVASSTLAALDERVAQAEDAAVSIASGYAGGNARRYLDLIRAQNADPPDEQRKKAAERTTGFQPLNIQGRNAQEDDEDVPGFGGSATRPLPGRPRGRPRPLDDASEVYQSPDQENEPVLPATRQAIQEHADEAGYSADALARIIRFESGGKPWIRNATSGATGLIQFMPKTFASLKKPPGYENIRFEDLPHLTADEQMPLVIQYLRQAGLPPNADAGEMYLAVAAPGFLGKPDDRVVYPKGSKAWEQNRAWRPADGGDITVGDIRRKGRSLRAP